MTQGQTIFVLMRHALCCNLVLPMTVGRDGSIQAGSLLTHITTQTIVQQMLFAINGATLPHQMVQLQTWLSQVEIMMENPIRSMHSILSQACEQLNAWLGGFDIHTYLRCHGIGGGIN